MDSMAAFVRGEATRGARRRVFDWMKAARLIRDRQPRVAYAGLSQDWEWTGGMIYTADGIPETSDAYLESTWAIPEISLDGDIEDCWVYVDETDGWDCDTFWPPEALRLLTGDTP